MSYDIYVHYKDGYTKNYPLCGSSTAKEWEKLAEQLDLTFFRVIQGMQSIYTREDSLLFVYEMAQIASHIDDHPVLDPNDLIKDRIRNFLLPAMTAVIDHWEDVEDITY